ncbi:MAG: aldehyde ferredoxin oxidoreductase C-terminal domain-containing protein [Desulfatirhabdiaceae bacterium]|nr:aldehyde ferredoxin oxidoreductase C-terminal domain-containing protein [Desulfatirhabdiaceae bacterium]
MIKWIRVNTREGSVRTKACSEQELQWGGRNLIAKVLLREVPPACDPIGRYNKLILAGGLLGETTLTTAGRLSIGGKSPLTGGVKESNVGGDVGRKMARLGIRAVIIEDAPDVLTPKVLYIGKKESSLLPVPELAGLAVSDTFGRLRQRYGEDVGIMCIGPAGEMRLSAALVAVHGAASEQTRMAGRGGLGAVMGAKGIKAVVFDDRDAKPEKAYDSNLMRDVSKDFSQILLADPKTENRHNFGTPAVLGLCNELGILPTRNFSAGRFERADNISGEAIANLIKARGGDARRGLPCVKGCVIRCSNIFADPNGRKTVASIQYENIALLGSNLDIGEVDDVAELNDLCNDVGVDAIEAGAAIGVAMEAGVLPFGDAKGAKDILSQIGRGTPLGRIIGSGVCITGKVFGMRRVPAVKGQAIPAYDPRALKGIGVTYVMSPMGADHTAGNALETVGAVNPLGTEGQIEISRRLQLRAAIIDSLGLCLFVRPAFVKDISLFGRMLKARYGWDWTYEDVQKMGAACLEDERMFNEKAGVSEDFFQIPEFMRDEPLPPRNTVFDVSLEQMKKIWDVQPPDNQF